MLTTIVIETQMEQYMLQTGALIYTKYVCMLFMIILFHNITLMMLLLDYTSELVKC
jgi:hypothetical protein